MDQRPSEAKSVYNVIAELEAAQLPFVLVILVEALGSTPQNSGAKMLVSPSGLIAGTIGGGRIEAKAIAFAQDLLSQSGVTNTEPKFVNWTLKGDAGMTCGGSVKLYFEPHPATDALWTIAIFGAGHITQALLPVLLPLRCSVRVYDTRSEWILRAPRAANLRAECLADLPAALDGLPDSTFVLCMTQGHKTDRPILSRALKTRKFPFLGCIGSDAKAAILREELISDGLASEHVQQIHCPVGLSFGTNHPHEIALSIAAQLVSVRDRLQASASNDAIKRS